jgi:AAA+ superfamily predicted ATPase
MNPFHLTLKFAEIIRPLSNELKLSSRKKLAGLLLSDLSCINTECGFLDSAIAEQPALISVMFIAAVKTVIEKVAFGPFVSDLELENYILHWDELNVKSRQNVMNNCNELAIKLFAKGTQKEKFDALRAPNAIQNMDLRYGTNYYHSVATALYRYAWILVSARGSVSAKENKFLKKIWKMLFLAQGKRDKNEAHAAESNSKNSAAKKHPSSTAQLQERKKEETLDDVLNELNELIGLKNIKKEVKTLVNYLRLQKERSLRGLSETSLSLHCVFYGPPGTGKTTVARLMSRIFKQMGFLEKGHLVETDRAGLVGSYIGHTSNKVDKKVSEALGGVLFIDEAYALKPDEDSGRDFGQEAIDILIKRMEDYRDKLVVIAAGYPDEMERFVHSNPGLKSRINRYYYFDHYSPKDLLAIFKIFTKKSNYHISKKAGKKLLNLFKALHSMRDRSFGNGRLSRNLFEKIIERQANRLAGLKKISDDVLIRIEEADIPGEKPGDRGKLNDDKYTDEGERSESESRKKTPKTAKRPGWMKKRRHRK